MKCSHAPFLSSNSSLKLVFRAVGGELWQGRNIDGRSNARWCRTGKLSTAAMASEPENSPRGSRKRVSKTERKAMVESFVNKYRAQNGGQFPNISVAQKEVGGSYYVIRSIMQELMYTSKHGLEVETRKNNSAKGTLKDSEIKTSSEVEFPQGTIVVEELSTSHSRIEVLNEHTVEVKDVSIVGVTPEIVVQKSIEEEPARLPAQNQNASTLPSSKDVIDVHAGDLSALQEVVVDSASDSSDVPCAHSPENISESIRKGEEDQLNSTPRHLPKEDCDISHRQEAVHDGESKKSVEDTLKPSLFSSKPLDERKSSDLNRAQRDLSSKTMDEVGAEKKSSSLWSNLKDFAGSIISLWKKQ